jgi:hypothetical protein
MQSLKGIRDEQMNQARARLKAWKQSDGYVAPRLADEADERDPLAIPITWYVSARAC